MYVWPCQATWDKTFERVVTNCEDAKRDDSTESLFELEKTGGPVLSVRLANLVVTQAAYMEKYGSLRTLPEQNTSLESKKACQRG